MVILIIIILKDIILPGFMTIFPALCSERKNKYDMIVVILAVELVVVVAVNNHLELPDFLVQMSLHQHSLLLQNSVKRDLSPSVKDTEFWRRWR